VAPGVSESLRFHHQYATNIQSCSSEAARLANAYAGQDLALNFVIPVYDNMPVSRVSEPTSNEVGSGDVSVSGRIVRTNSRFSTTQPDSPNPSVVPTAAFNTELSISDSYITGVASGITAGALVSALGVTEGSLTVYNSLGTELSGNEVVGTGTTVYLYNNSNQIQATYNVVIHGDINGDGDITILDLLRIRKQLMGIATLTGPYAEAADTNGDGDVAILDLLRVRKHLMGLISLA